MSEQEQKNTDAAGKNASEQTSKKRAWWEIPARSAVFFIILIIMLPGHWYRAAYLFTIGRLFPETIESRVASFGQDVQKRLDLKELPSKLRILVLKAEKQVELWGKMNSGVWKKINYYPTYTMPGEAGPKLHKDEAKTPEGIYNIAELDPNSIFTLAVKLDYPSKEDIEIARKEGRDPESMKTDFLLHGFGFSPKNISLTDKGMEEMFYLFSKVGLNNVKVLIAPGDFRKDHPAVSKNHPWLQKRYEDMKTLMDEMKETKEKDHAASGND